MDKPFITVICPIRNEENHITRCLQSIMNQDYERGLMEVLVVDGMSDDNTRVLVREQKALDDRLVLLDNPSRIVPVAMNIGIKHARGEIIVRLDGHAMIAADYLGKCVFYLDKTGADCVGGPMESINHTYVGRGIALAMSFPFGVGRSRFRTSRYSGYVDTLAFGAYRREVFNRIGLFDEELVRCQDDELNYRLRKFGGRIYMNTEIRSQYFPRASLKKLWRQYFQYGFWKVRVMQKHTRMMQPRQFVPLAFICALLLSAMCALFFRPASLAGAGLLGLYVAANLCASLFLALKRGLQYLPLLPLGFSLLHFSYGLGSLWGLIKFAGRWRKAD
jgi:glycosyltransferase involved in cell wall biosynthesis